MGGEVVGGWEGVEGVEGREGNTRRLANEDKQCRLCLLSRLAVEECFRMICLWGAALPSASSMVSLVS